MGDFTALDRHVEQETLQVLKALDQQAKELEALMVGLMWHFGSHRGIEMRPTENR